MGKKDENNEGTTVNVNTDDHDHSKEAYRTKEEPAEPTTTVEVDGDTTNVTVEEQ